mmetsp:Transcript_24008/g.61081  ORF Transcript_24008/g.61081 Transcript_24008/m.61081 type:complete len:277 (-) Transcript_24008:239-1069(-)
MTPPPHAYDDGLDGDVSDDFEDDLESEDSDGSHRHSSSDAERASAVGRAWPDPFDAGTEASDDGEPSAVGAAKVPHHRAANPGVSARIVGAGSDRMALALAHATAASSAQDDRRQGDRRGGYGYYMRNPLMEDAAGLRPKRKRQRSSSRLCDSSASCSSDSNVVMGSTHDDEMRRGRKRKVCWPPREGVQAKLHRGGQAPDFAKMSSAEMNRYVRWWRKMHALTWKGRALATSSVGGALPRASTLPSQGAPRAASAWAVAAAAAVASASSASALPR